MSAVSTNFNDIAVKSPENTKRHDDGRAPLTRSSLLNARNVSDGSSYTSPDQDAYQAIGAGFLSMPLSKEEGLASLLLEDHSAAHDTKTIVDDDPPDLRVSQTSNEVAFDTVLGSNALDNHQFSGSATTSGFGWPYIPSAHAAEQEYDSDETLLDVDSATNFSFGMAGEILMQMIQKLEASKISKPLIVTPSPDGPSPAASVEISVILAQADSRADSLVRAAVDLPANETTASLDRGLASHATCSVNEILQTRGDNGRPLTLEKPLLAESGSFNSYGSLSTSPSGDIEGLIDKLEEEMNVGDLSWKSQLDNTMLDACKWSAFLSEASSSGYVSAPEARTAPLTPSTLKRSTVEQSEDLCDLSVEVPLSPYLRRVSSERSLLCKTFSSKSGSPRELSLTSSTSDLDMAVLAPDVVLGGSQSSSALTEGTRREQSEHSQDSVIVYTNAVSSESDDSSHYDSESLSDAESSAKGSPSLPSATIASSPAFATGLNLLQSPTQESPRSGSGSLIERLMNRVEQTNFSFGMAATLMMNANKGVDLSETWSEGNDIVPLEEAFQQEEHPEELAGSQLLRASSSLWTIQEEEDVEVF